MKLIDYPQWLTEFECVVPKNSDFFKQFDTDGDGYISFSEYLLIVTFLAIPLEVTFHAALLLPVNPKCCEPDSGGRSTFLYPMEDVRTTYLSILRSACLQDVEIIFSMFDDDDSGAISLTEFKRVTTALRLRLRRVSHLQRTGLQTDSTCDLSSFCFLLIR